MVRGGLLLQLLLRGVRVVLEGVHAWDSHIQHRPRSMFDEREGLLGLKVVVTRVLNGVYDNCSSVFK